MHKIIWCCFFFHLVFTLPAQTAGHSFVFTGTMQYANVSLVYLDYVNEAAQFVHDSSRLTNGKFQFSGTIGGPVSASFYSSSAKAGHPQFTILFLQPGKTEASFTRQNFRQGKISGSKSNDEYALYTTQTDALDKKWIAVLQALNDWRKGLDEEKNFAIYSRGLPFYQQESRRLKLQFIQRHPQSYVSSYLLAEEMYNLPFDSLRYYFKKLSPGVQHGADGKPIGQYIQKEEAITIGQPAPNFTQPDTSGKIVSLQDFRGKYVLLDFWASWCVPCREESPYLRQAFSLFKENNFTIISLSLDREQDKQAWLQAIAKDSLNWPQLCDFKAWGNEVAKAYNVISKGIPANFLIAPDGNITDMNLRGPEMIRKLKKQLR